MEKLKLCPLGSHWIILQELELIMCPVIIDGFGICYLFVCVCVVPLSQPSDRDLNYPRWDIHRFVIFRIDSVTDI